MPPSCDDYTQQMHTLCHTVPQWTLGALHVNNALRCIAEALRQPALHPCAFALAYFSWQCHPLDAQLAFLAHKAAQQPTCHTPEKTLALTQKLAQWCTAPQTDTQPATIIQQMDAAQVRDVLTPRLQGAHGGYWLQQGLEWCYAHMQDATSDNICENLLQCACASDSTLQPLHQRLWHQWNMMLTGEYTLETSLPLFPLWHLLQSATSQIQQNDTAGALCSLSELWQACPWHPNLILALYELRHPFPPVTDSPLPPIGLYSWNNAALLRDTLTSLGNTEAVHAPLLVLNNGSNDDTEAVLHALPQQWGGTVRCMQLPVNIGAPAARNWLLQQPEINAAQELLFLDDDVLVQPGWLYALQRAMHALPDISVLGCRIEEHAPPHATQNGAFFLTDEGARSFVDLEEHIFIQCDMSGCTDRLLTRYTRPCVSVSGCCHWLRLDAPHGGGQGFDIRFSPSQFDDFERDIRLQCHGHHIAYTGTSHIRHVQRSSLKQAVTRAKNAHIFGNKIKLEYLYPQEDVTRICHSGHNAARTDLLRKAHALCHKDTA